MERVEIERLKELKVELTGLDERLRRYYEQATRTTALLDGLPKSSVLRSKIEENLVKIRGEMAENEGKIVEYYRLESRFREEIKALPSLQRQILSLRYLDSLGFRRIAATLQCSVSHVFQQHRRALKKILSECSKVQ